MEPGSPQGRSGPSNSREIVPWEGSAERPGPLARLGPELGQPFGEEKRRLDGVVLRAARRERRDDHEALRRGAELYEALYAELAAEAGQP